MQSSEKCDLTHARLREVLSYEPSTGDFTWAISGPSRRLGAKAGCLRPDGYSIICVDRKKILAHRLAWFYEHGEWPAEIDHKNGNRQDNRIENLRLVSRSENCENLRGAKSHNQSGYLGVSRNGSRWKALIVVKGRRVHLGTFQSPELAHSVYLKAKRAFHAHSTI